MLADSGLGSEDQSVRPVIESVDDVVRFRDRGNAVRDHRLEQIRRDEHRGIQCIRTADDVLLVDGHVFDRHLA